LRNLAAGSRRFVTSEFFRHGLLVFISSTLVNALGYAFHFAISRRIGVEQYGVLSALNAALMISFVVSQIVSTVVVKYAAEFRATGDDAHLAALTDRLTRYGAAAAVLVILAGLAATRPIAGFLQIANLPAVALCVSIIGVSMWTPALRAIFQGVEDFNVYAISVVVESLGKAVLGIVFVYAGFGVDGAFAGWALGSVIALAYTAWAAQVRFRRVPGGKLFIDFRRLVLTMANVSAATLVLTCLSYSDVIVVKHFADPTTAGLYGALSLSGKILLFLVGFVPTIVLPKASRVALSGKSPIGVFVQALGIIFAMSGTGLAAYYFFPRLVITALAGGSFAPAAPYVFSYGFSMVLLAGINVIVVYKMGIHRFDFVLPLTLCAVGELVGISVHHGSLADVISVLIVGNAIALVTSAFRVTAPLRSRMGVAASDAAA
jgi:O-antigen/teichoic acid export membrane protein